MCVTTAYSLAEQSHLFSEVDLGSVYPILTLLRQEGFKPRSN